MHTHDAICQAPSLLPANLALICVLSRKNQYQCQSNSFIQGSGFSHLVDKARESSSGNSFPHTYFWGYHHYWCIPVWLESSYGQSYCTRHLYLLGVQDACQFTETKSCPSSLQCFRPLIWSRHIRIVLDNITVFYINKQGETRSLPLCVETVILWIWCIRLHKTLSTAYLSGLQNSAADSLSRRFSADHEWQIHDSVLNKIYTKWTMPSWDLFTSQAAKKPFLCSDPEQL